LEEDWLLPIPIPNNPRTSEFNFGRLNLILETLFSRFIAIIRLSIMFFISIFIFSMSVAVGVGVDLGSGDDLVPWLGIEVWIVVDDV